MYMKIKFKNGFTKTGFTIVEIVVIVGIMAVLTTVIFASLDNSKKKSRDQKRVADISAVQLALEQFFARKNYYPTTITGLELIPTYMAAAPESNVIYAPLTSLNSPTNTQCASYHLYITLESNISVLDSRKNFNSQTTNTPTCAGTDLRINAKLNPLIYDVTP